MFSNFGTLARNKNNSAANKYCLAERLQITGTPFIKEI